MTTAPKKSPITAAPKKSLIIEQKTRDISIVGKPSVTYDIFFNASEAGKNTISTGAGDDIIINSPFSIINETDLPSTEILAIDINGRAFLESEENPQDIFFDKGNGEYIKFDTSTDGSSELATDNNIVIKAGNGNNYIFSQGNNTITAGTGNDFIITGNGNDFIRAGNGNNSVFAHSGDNTVITGSGIDNVRIYEGNNIISTGAGNDTIINDWGTEGVKGNNTITGGAGNDIIQGGTGADLYAFHIGDGKDTITEQDSTKINSNAKTPKDIIWFGKEVDYKRLWFTHSGNDLVASIIGTQDSVTIINGGVKGAAHIEQFSAGGKSLMDSRVNALVQAMAAVAPPAAITSFSTPEYANVAAVIAASWK